MIDYSTTKCPFETEDLRSRLVKFLDTEFKNNKVGNFKYGVYAFFDYEGEPIYVGQTKESLRTRIRRHLTNRRTDAVAMSVLDPMEVYEVEVWPLTQFEKKLSPEDRILAGQYLDALEHHVYSEAIKKSRFSAVLNEKAPPEPKIAITTPDSLRMCIVSDKVVQLRNHPDLRIARRAATMAKLAHIISERKVTPSLRSVLNTQAQRLQWLTDMRFSSVSKSDSASSEE